MTPSPPSPSRGILLMIAATAIFAAQDGLSRHLASEANVVMVVTVRYWFFALFAVALVARRPGLRVALQTRRPWLQAGRGVLLAAEVCVMIWAFTLLGLAESHAVFAAAPLLIAALSGPVLGERVGWRRWAAIGAGCVGVLLILSPGSGTLRIEAAVPLLAALMWALYNLVTRLVASEDGSATSFLWAGLGGAAVLTPFGLWAWEPMAGPDWALMGVLCLTAAAGHWMLIRCYELAEASAVQPFAYLQLVFATAVGVLVFGEALRLPAVAGAAIVVGAGLFTLWRERVRARSQASPSAQTLRETA